MHEGNMHPHKVRFQTLALQPVLKLINWRSQPASTGKGSWKQTSCSQFLLLLLHLSVIYSHFACALKPQEQKSPLPLIFVSYSMLAWIKSLLNEEKNWEKKNWKLGSLPWKEQTSYSCWPANNLLHFLLQNDKCHRRGQNFYSDFQCFSFYAESQNINKAIEAVGIEVHECQ